MKIRIKNLFKNGNKDDTSKLSYDELEAQNTEKNIELSKFKETLPKIKELTQKLEKMNIILGEKEELFRTVLETIPSAVFIIHEMKVVYCNSAAEEVTGYEPNELQSMTNFIKNMIYTDDRKKAHKAFMSLFDDEKEKESIDSINEILRICRRNGSLCWVNLFGREVFYNEQYSLMLVVTDITEIRSKTNALQENVERFENLYKNAQIGLFRIQLDSGIILECSNYLLNMFKVEKSEDVIGREIGRWFVRKEDRKRHIKLLLEKGRVDNFECEFYTNLGQKVFVRTSSILQQEGYVEGIVLDLTDQKLAECEIREGENILSTLFNIANSTNKIEELSVLYNEVYSSLSKIMNLPSFIITLYNEELKELEFGFSNDLKGFDESGNPIKLKFGGEFLTCTEKIIEENSSRLFTKNEIEELLTQTGRKFFGEVPELLFGTPLRIQGKIIGAIVVRYFDKNDFINRREISIIESISDYMALAIRINRDRAKILEANNQLKTINDELELKVERRTKSIAEREEMFRVMAENSQDVIMRFDRNYRHCYVNKAVEKTVTLKSYEFIGKTHKELGFPDDMRIIWEDALKKVFDTGKQHSIEFKLGDIWLNWLISPEILYGSEEVLHVITSARNITERVKDNESLEKIIEERTFELRREKDKYHTVFEGSGTAMFLYTEDTLITMVNNTFSDLIGYSKEELLGTSWTKYLDPDELRRLVSDNNILNKSLIEPCEYEIKLVRKDEVIRDVILRIVKIKSINQRLASFLDITIRKKIEKTLRNAASGLLLGEILKEANKITAEQLSTSLQEQVSSKNTKRLGEILKSNGIVKFEDIEFALEKQKQILFDILSNKEGEGEINV